MRGKTYHKTGGAWKPVKPKPAKKPRKVKKRRGY